MFGHASKVISGDRRIEPFKSACLSKRHPPRFDLASEALDFGNSFYPLVIRVAFIDIPRIGSHQGHLKSPQIFLGFKKTEKNSLKSSCAAVVLLIWIGRRSDNAVHRARGEQTIEVPGVGLDDCRARCRSILEVAQIVNHSLDLAKPRVDDRGVVFGFRDADFWSKLNVADRRN